MKILRNRKSFVIKKLKTKIKIYIYMIKMNRTIFEKYRTNEKIKTKRCKGCGYTYQTYLIHSDYCCYCRFKYIM